MRYTVLWTSSAEAHLASLWMSAVNPNELSTAANAIDRLLARDPEAQGKPRFDTVRTLSIPPLGVDFEIIEADRLVYVLSVWNVSNGSSP